MRDTRRGADDGAAAVEFALVVPILLLLVFGVINFGLIFASQISMNAAARDASRAGVVQPLGSSGLTCADIATKARANAGTIGARAINIAVSVTSPAGNCLLPAGSSTVGGPNPTATMCTGSAATGGQLVVNLTYGYVSPVPLVPPNSMTLTADGKFKCEYS